METVSSVILFNVLYCSHFRHVFLAESGKKKKKKKKKSKEADESGVGPDDPFSGSFVKVETSSKKKKKKKKKESVDEQEED
jgi:hypothetical protein